MAHRIIDSDGHLMEYDKEIYEYLEPPYRGVSAVTGYPFFPTLDGFQGGKNEDSLGECSEILRRLNSLLLRGDEAAIVGRTRYSLAGY